MSPLPANVAPFFDDEDCFAATIHVCLITYVCWLFFPFPRSPSLFEQRLNWVRHRDKHHNRGTLKRRIRMEKASFNKLLSYIEADLTVNEFYANLRGGPIIAELCLCCALRWLAGGSYLDITDIAGISTGSMYRVVWKTIAAIIRAPQLTIHFPKTAREVQLAIDGFASISHAEAIRNCALVIDGYLLRIKTPNKKEAGNVRAFFSGHYQCYGVNVQAGCDHHCRFAFLAFSSPGVTADRCAVKHCNLFNLIEGLPLGIVAIGDAAYDPTEHMVPVFYGADKLKPRCDNFNFYASQLRIRIEMAFGLMQSKWGVLQRPVTAKLSNVKDMVQAIGRLHNFVINERLLSKGIPLEGADVDGGGPRYMPSIPHDENGDPTQLDEAFVSLVAHSEIRERMADRVEELGLKRPKKNSLKRNHNDI